MKSFSCALLGFLFLLVGCSSPVCGDGIIGEGEACDDGNTQNADACQASCQLPTCGDGITDISQGELCDDGNLSDNDECLRDCTPNVCGDGVLNPSAEECDDGNNTSNDGCDADCAFTIDQISAGRYHTCALLHRGAVRCWGLGGFAALGYGNPNNIGDNETPASAGDVPLGGTAVQIAAGGFSHTCALLDTGAVRCWGAGVLGYGNPNIIGDNETLASVGDLDLGGTAVQITAGQGHTCALLTTGNVRCWGINNSGALGYGNTENIGDDETPASAGDIDLGGTAVQVSAGGAHTCALLETGAVRCWGGGQTGALGYGNLNSVGNNKPPAAAGDVPLGGIAVQVSAGERHTCALLTTGAVRCWGEGILGYGNTNIIGDDETPASMGDLDLGGTAVQIAASGSSTTCALLETGAVRCWGAGILGYGNTIIIGDNETPASAGDVPLGATAVQISASTQSICALLSTGAARCWGRNDVGQLGYGNTESIGDNETPASAGDISLF